MIHEAKSRHNLDCQQETETANDTANKLCDKKLFRERRGPTARICINVFLNLYLLSYTETGNQQVAYCSV